MLQLLALLVVFPGVVPQPQDGNRVRLATQTKLQEISDIALSSRGDRFITHELHTRSSRLWDRATMRVLRVLDPGGAVAVPDFEFTPSGEYFLSTSFDEVRVWDATYGRRVAQYNLRTGLNAGAGASDDGYAGSTSISPDGRFYAASKKSGDVEVFTLPNLKLIRTLVGHTMRVFDLEFTPDGTRLVGSSREDIGRIWNVATGESVVLQNHPSGMFRMNLSSDGKYVLTTGYDGQARLFETETGDFVRSVAPTERFAVFVGERGDQVLVTADDGTRSVHAMDGTLLGEVMGHPGAIYRTSLSPDHTKVALFDDEQLVILDVTQFTRMAIDIGQGTPTCGKFSPDGSEFWVGMLDGSYRRYDMATGEYDSDAAVITVLRTKSLVSPSGRWLYFSSDVYPPPETEARAWFMDAYNPSERREIGLLRVQPEWSADETRVLLEQENEFGTVYLYDISRGRIVNEYGDDCAGSKMSPVGNTFVTWHFDGAVNIWDIRDGEPINSWQFGSGGGAYAEAVDYHPTESLLVAAVSGDEEMIVFDIHTGAVDLRLDIGPPASAGASNVLVAFSPNGQSLAYFNERYLQVWDYPSGQPIMRHTFDDDIAYIDRPAFSPDGSMIALRTISWTIVLDVLTGETLKKLRTIGSYDWPIEWSPQGLLNTHNGTHVFVWDPRREEPLVTIRRPGAVEGTQFSRDGKRLFTRDDSDGLTIWELSGIDELTAEPVGSFVHMKNGESWLAWDADGRFDASDPNAVDGAHFVLEWSGGLEVVDVSQLKERYYDPGLLAKILGTDPEPRRAVPQIDDLRIFPVVQLRSGSSLMDLQIGVTERDEGGVGKLQMSINGKRVFTDPKPPGFFSIDLSLYEQYFLPQSQLPEGLGNVVSITVMNGRGTLTSPPISIDVGVPVGLQTPSGKLYALFVGIGDYVGTASDLAAPPNDARALELAVRTVAENLLPGQVETTLLTAAPGQPNPATRADILAWFEETATRATSSDIVMVFFSGHGVNKIGGQEDYFFLTPEADPKNVGVLSVESATISGRQLSRLLTGIPAMKQILILDTCHAGAVSQQLLALSRSVGGDYRRAWEAMRDATGTWLLAGSASNQSSFEAPNVGYGVMTYALLIAIDQGSSDALRAGSEGQLFVDVERWLSYASMRVESLKNEIGITGIQVPQYTGPQSGASFDIGVMDKSDVGFLDIRPPMPIVVVGEFNFESEDPLRLESLVRAKMFESQDVKTWSGATRQPGVYRIAAQYELVGSEVTVKVFVQKYDDAGNRKTIERFELSGKTTSLPVLAAQVRDEAVKRILQLEKPEERAA